MSWAETWGYTLQDSQVFRFQHVVLWLVVALAFSVIIRSLNELSDLERRRQEEDRHEKLPVIRDKEYFETKSRTEGLKMSEKGSEVFIVAGIGTHLREHYDHPLFSTWKYLLNACYNREDSWYSKKGARGNTVCERWLSFQGFADDVIPLQDSFKRRGLPCKSIATFFGKKEFCLENCFFWEGDKTLVRKNIVVNYRGTTKIFDTLGYAANACGTRSAVVQRCLYGMIPEIRGRRLFSTQRDYSGLSPNHPYISYNRYMGFVDIITGNLTDQLFHTKGNMSYLDDAGLISGYRVDIPDNIRHGHPEIVGEFVVSREAGSEGNRVSVVRLSHGGPTESRACFGGDLLIGVDRVSGKRCVVGATAHSPYVKGV